MKKKRGEDEILTANEHDDFTIKLPKIECFEQDDCLPIESVIRLKKIQPNPSTKY